MGERKTDVSAEESERIAADLNRQRQAQLTGLIIVVVAALMALISRISGGAIFGLSFSFWGPFAAVLLVAKLAFLMIAWRCPRCRASLGSSYRPRYCPGCGVKLSRPAE